MKEFLALPDSKIFQTIAQKDSEFSNSIVERLNQTMKYDYLFPQEPQTFEQFLTVFGNAVLDYNLHPNGSFFGVPPHEATRGIDGTKTCTRLVR